MSNLDQKPYSDDLYSTISFGGGGGKPKPIEVDHDSGNFQIVAAMTYPNYGPPGTQPAWASMMNWNDEKTADDMK